MRKTILNDNTLSVHFEQYKKDQTAYTTAVTEVFSNTEYFRSVSVPNRARVLAVLLQKLDKLTFRNISFDLPEVLLACQILDARRELKQIARKQGEIEARLVDASKKTAGKLRRLRKHLNDRKSKLETVYEGVSDLSLTSSKIALVKEWVKIFTEDELTFRALMFHRAPWRELADLCHFNPKDFQCDWFLTYCFSGKAPENSVMYKIKNGSVAEIGRLYETNPIPYEYLRLNKHLLNDFMKTAVARKENLRTVLWYADEIGNHDVIATRLETESVDLPYGKLVDLIGSVRNARLVEALVRVAEQKLSEYQLTLPSPVVVLGDASASMEVAIKTSGIVASLLCALCKAELRLFNNRDQYINNPPRTVRDAVEFGRNMRASSCTAPAISLRPYLDQRKVVKTFIVVTDEVENTASDGNQSGWYGTPTGRNYFADTFKNYIRLVHRARLIFITFTDSPNEDGKMVAALKSVLGDAAVEELVTVFKFGLRNPDLRKLDVVLAKLAEMRDDPELIDVPAQVTDPTEHKQALADFLGADPNSDSVTISKDLLNQLWKEATKKQPQPVQPSPFVQQTANQFGQQPGCLHQ
jgi:hypothetical protein